MFSRRCKLLTGLPLLLLWAARPEAARGLNVPNGSDEVNNRFLSGYAAAPVTAPVSNTSARFAGYGYDWSGVGWDASNPKKSFGLISPRHYLVAAHYGGAAFLQFWGAGGTLYTAAQQTAIATGMGPSTESASPDIALGVLTEPVPASAKVTFYPVLDLVPSLTATTISNYTLYRSASYRNYLMYGFTGKVASNTLVNIGYSNTGIYVTSNAAGAALQDGDSGSPAFKPWTDPSGRPCLTLLGYNWAVDNRDAPSVNFHALLPVNEVAARLNALMAEQGYALRWVAPASGTWRGIDAVFGNRDNWSGGSVPTGDTYAAFAGDKADHRAVALNADQSARGIFFLSAGAGNAFSFAAGRTLFIGRGGIVNDDANHTQTFQCGVTMTDAQWWESGGGLTLTGAIANGGYQLVIDGTGATVIGGTLSGPGGLGKEGSGTLTLSGGGMTFGGPLFIHNGILNLSGTLSGGGAVTVEAGGTLQGNGTISVSGTRAVRIGGTLSPGDAVTAGTLAFASGPVIFSAGATLQLNAGSQNDRVEIAGGAVTLGGTLQIVPGAGFSYAGSCRVLSGLSALPSGTFAAVGGIDAGFLPLFTLDGSDYTLRWTAATYSAWRQIHFTVAEIDAGLAAETADPDSDGFSNLLEYALGLDPRAAPAAAAAPAVSASNGYLTLSVAKNPNATDLVYSVEVTGDLTHAASWTASETTVLNETAATLTVRDNVPVTGASRRFIRLRITRQ